MAKTVTRVHQKGHLFGLSREYRFKSGGSRRFKPYEFLPVLHEFDKPRKPWTSEQFEKYQKLLRTKQYKQSNQSSDFQPRLTTRGKIKTRVKRKYKPYMFQPSKPKLLELDRPQEMWTSEQFENYRKLLRTKQYNQLKQSFDDHFVRRVQ